MLGANTVTFNSKTLNKILSPPEVQNYKFKDSTEQYLMSIRHSTTKVGRLRHNVEVTHTVWATTEEPEIVRKSYFVMEHSLNDESVVVPAALCTFLTASTNAVLGELIDEMI